MPVTKLFLVRHGQSAGNAEGRFGGHSATPLSELGRKQAELTAAVLAREGITAIYSSDLERAMQSAQPLAELSGVAVTATPSFRERNVGVLEGLTFDESKAAHPADYYALVNRNVHHVITNGESYRHLLQRSTGMLWEILRTPPPAGAPTALANWAGEADLDWTLPRPCQPLVIWIGTLRSSA